MRCYLVMQKNELYDFVFQRHNKAYAERSRSIKRVVSLKDFRKSGSYFLHHT